ncbi:probable C-mannosyltransferase DPY19L1 [Polyodon spathula]|uniref:probable C-mannosyltransferase DPY19L1 n=1 Tax=Polyodon spathula TaxID=7913 RepID=UPI001B7EF052|nr:probable C-mannosyltransferase DPY19L1 [Polyodon spathula]
MAVKTRLQAYREHTKPQDSVADHARSPVAARKSSRLSSKRGVRDSKQPSSINSLIQNSTFAASIKSKLGLSPYVVIKIGITLIIAAVVGILHWYHISNLFENDRHFSHLSTLEKEMAFRTEMGLYYSYFKTIIEAPSFFNGLHMVMNDRLTEYPLVINTLKRFNLYPEVVLAIWYRIYTAIMGFLGIATKMCWAVNRGDGLKPIESCEGLGDPAYFYVTFVFILNGLMLSLFFIYGTYLSGSRLGGLVTVLCFFYNHGESTRVMWTPPLRESFSYPFLVLQMLLLTYILRSSRAGKAAFVALGVSNVFFMLPWQFAQFVLLTQIASLFAAHIVGYLGYVKLRSLLYVHMMSLLVCFVLMFGNGMLLTSFYASSLVTIWVIIAIRTQISQFCKTAVLTCVAQGVGWFISTVLLKFLSSVILGVSDDAHISNLIKSKFTSYKDFDTLMYTCAAEFDFMEKETPVKYLKTLLVPMILCVSVIIIEKAVTEVWGVLRMSDNKSDGTEHTLSKKTAYFANGEMVYHVLQLTAFTVLAVLIMRLKLFLTPHMCIMASLICSRQLFGWIKWKYNHHGMVLVIIVVMSVQGFANLRNQWSIMGEFSNIPQEELLEWIKANTKPDDVFAGAMPTMASVKLSAERPVVNHPHYEDARLRATTKLVYSMYSRKTADEVKWNLMKLQVDYFVLEDSWCTRQTRPGCSLPEIWDVEDPYHAGKTPICTLLAINPHPHFVKVFENNVYRVLKLTKDR